MASQAGVSESLDFDFFETPRSPPEETPAASPQISASRPPIRPRSAKPVEKPNSDLSQGDGKDKNKASNGNRKNRSPSPSGSLSSRSSSPEYSSNSLSDNRDDRARGKTRGNRKSASNSSSKSSVSVSSDSDSRSLSPSRSRSRSHSMSKSGSSSSYSDSSPKRRSDSKVDKFHSSSESDSNGRPTNPTAKAKMPKRGRSRQGDDEDCSSSAYSGGDDSSMKKPPSSQGNVRRSSVKAQGMSGNKRQAWGDDIKRDDKEKRQTKSLTVTKNRPKTAKGGKTQTLQRKSRSKSPPGSASLSDSDMTDVSPMESPRNVSKKKSRDGQDRFRMTGAGDSGSIKVQYRAMPVTDADLDCDEEEADIDRQKGGLDLDILMKAVGELEKQKRLQANSRRVMFAPMTLKRNEKSNYTFDQSQTKAIERENQRLLKEIVRRVSSGEAAKRYMARQSAYKLTPSAINREREMKRIESENLAFLKRLQKVKPTKTISRDNQLQAYESTTLHGVPIAALHPMRKSGRRSVIDDGTSSIGSRTRSMTSIHSSASSVLSAGSRRSSRPSSATKRIDTRPQWTDRW